MSFQRKLAPADGAVKKAFGGPGKQPPAADAADTEFVTLELRNR